MSLFVAGTDTDVGKTLVSQLLVHCFSKLTETHYYKPVQAGAPTDFDQVKPFLSKPENLKSSSYFLKKPMSPNRAAALESVEISLSKITEDWRQRESGFFIVEGAGGLLVPINDQQKVIDIPSALNIPCLLVTSTRLGTINHTLLSVEALKSRGIDCLGIVLNGVEDPGLSELLAEQSGLPILFSVPKLDSINADSFDDLLNKNEELRGFVDSCLSNTSIEDEVVDLKAKDKNLVWHPFTQHGIVKDHGLVSRGQGSQIEVDGQWVIDGISSWWVNLFGHSHPLLNKSINEQLEQLQHVMFAGFTHQPAVELADKLVKLVNESGINLKKVFYSDNGSTAVEVALKMAYQYFVQKGEGQRKRFLALKGSYHGDTLGAMSVGEREGFNQVFTPLMFPVDFVDPFNESELEDLFARYGSEYAAVIVEPLIQGASGMRMYPKTFLEKLKTYTDQSGALVVFDEIFTGFYRTGTRFAFEQTNLKPDLLCLSKALTGGYLPLSATVVSESIFDSFQDSTMKTAFLHGHSYTANPLACAVASSTMDLIKDPQTVESVRAVSEWTKKAVEDCGDHSELKNCRSLGTIGAMEIGEEQATYFKGNFSYRFYKKALAKGVLLRPLGSTVYAVPPLCVSKNEVQKIYRSIGEIINEEF